MNNPPQQHIELTLLDVEDVEQLRAVALQAYREHYADTWYDNGAWYLQTYFSTARLQEELADKNARFFLINYNGVPVGFVKLNLNKPLSAADENAVELERIYLVKSANGKGIGTFVLHFVFGFAREHQVKIIWLKAMDTSPDAVRFYQKNGFEICGTHSVDFPQKRDGMRGMYVMKKEL